MNQREDISQEQFSFGNLKDYSSQDILNLVHKFDFRRISFRYLGLDGRFKQLIIPINGLNSQEIEKILVEGERVDGSSLYPGIIDSTYSDILIIPDLSTAFVDPFDERNLSFICRYQKKDGELAPFTLDTILLQAEAQLRKTTGLELWVGGELEFYLIYDHEDIFYSPETQKGYHESSPFIKGLDFLKEAAEMIQKITGAVKYVHSEVGCLPHLESENPFLKGKTLEQLEIEFKTESVVSAADHLVLARWILRQLAAQKGMLVTFTPKIAEEVAGNGFHLHLELMREGQNIMVAPDGKLTQEALQLIGGLCNSTGFFLAFGNTMAASYYRLVPNQEAPTQLFWSDCNRSALIRVPLLNSHSQTSLSKETSTRKRGQTVELRSPDGSALIHPLLATISLAALQGLTEKNSLDIASQYYLSQEGASNFPKEKFPLLPSSCGQVARLVQDKRQWLEKNNVFPAAIVDYIIKLLEGEELEIITGERGTDLQKVLHRDLHRH